MLFTENRRRSSLRECIGQPEWEPSQETVDRWGVQYVKGPGPGDQLRNYVDVFPKWFVTNEEPDGGDDDDYKRVFANPFNRRFEKPAK